MTVRIIIPAAVVAVIVSIARPDIAHLVFQALLVVTLLTFCAEAVVRLVGQLPTNEWANKLRFRRRTPADLPYEIDEIANLLRRSRRYVPRPVVSVLARQFDARLRMHHGIRVRDAGELQRARRVLSPTALRIVASRSPTPGDVRALDRIRTAWLESLLTELEQL